MEVGQEPPRQDPQDSQKEQKKYNCYKTFKRVQKYKTHEERKEAYNKRSREYYRKNRERIRKKYNPHLTNKKVLRGQKNKVLEELNKFMVENLLNINFDDVKKNKINEIKQILIRV